MVVTQDPILINPFKDFIEEGGLEDACKGLEEFGRLSGDVFEKALSENKIYPYNIFSLEIALSLAKNSVAIMNNNEFFYIAINNIVYPIKTDKTDRNKFLRVIENVGPQILNYSSRFSKLEKRLMNDVIIKSARNDEFAEFFPMKKASVIVYEKDYWGNIWFNNLILRAGNCQHKNCQCKSYHLAVECETPVYKFRTYKEAVQNAMEGREIKTIAVCKSIWQYPFRETGIQLVGRKYAELINKGLEH